MLKQRLDLSVVVNGKYNTTQYKRRSSSQLCHHSFGRDPNMGMMVMCPQTFGHIVNIGQNATKINRISAAWIVGGSGMSRDATFSKMEFPQTGSC